jgi:cell division protein FtsQ
VPRDAGVLTRRRVLTRRYVAVSVLVGLAVIGIVMLWTPVLGVRSVDVSGEQLLTADQVRTAAQVPTGTPMLRLDTAAIAARVHQLPRVATVRVIRDWPSTIAIEVTERDPVGYVKASDGIHLVDSTGLDYAVVAKVPPGLPRVELTTVAPTDQRTQAVVGVLRALPAQLRTLVVTVSAKTPGSVTLGLRGGRTIRWGSADDSAQKAAVLAALMTRPGKVYDVSSPDLPTVS